MKTMKYAIALVRYLSVFALIFAWMSPLNTVQGYRIAGDTKVFTTDGQREANLRLPRFIPSVKRTYVKASNTQISDTFGIAVAVSGNTVVVGAHFEDSNATGVNGNQSDNSVDESGAVYVFTYNELAWSQQAYLKASNTDFNDRFGSSVAISGDTIAVGAFGESSNATGINGDQTNDLASNSGAVYIFTRTGSTWSQQAYLKASNTEANDQFGFSLAIEDDTVVVGAQYEDSNATGIDGTQANNSMVDSGAAYVFTRSGTTWTQQAYIKASNTGMMDYFGRSVALSGDTVVVGAFGESSNATGINGNENDNSASSAGAAYAFTRSGTVWTQQVYLKASNTQSADQFGVAVSIFDNTVVVGADMEDSAANGVGGNQADNTAEDAGAAYVFIRSGINWSQQAYLKASNSELYDNFGGHVSISAEMVVIGANPEDSNATGENGDQTDNSKMSAGAVYGFKRNVTTWGQWVYLKATNPEDYDNFGQSLAFSGVFVVVGAPGEDSNATGINGNETNNSMYQSGAVYIREFNPYASCLPYIIR
jgi:hypothetical protein